MRVRAALAEEQTRYFEECVEKAARETSPKEVAEYIEAVQNYYRSGTKQKTGSHLDQMVERARKHSITELNKMRADLVRSAEVKENK